MGDFLTIPNKTKTTENKENSKIRYGASCMQGWRKKMEDAHIGDISQGPNKNYDIFGVFDGHDGNEVPIFVKRHFTSELLNNINFKREDIQKGLKETFFKMDELMKQQSGKDELAQLNQKSKEEDDSLEKKPNKNQIDMLNNWLNNKKTDDEVSKMTGCTACICVIDESKKKLYFANVGDSRVVLCIKGTAYPKSIDHKPDWDLESKRIKKADGWIVGGRVKGNLCQSRMLGDWDYKANPKLSPEEQMITANPDIQCDNITNWCDFIIIGCNSIWDCLSNQEACDFVKNRLSQNNKMKLSDISDELLESLCATDIYNETGIGCDNMTFQIIQFMH